MEVGPVIVPGVAGAAGSTDIVMVLLVAGLPETQVRFEMSTACTLSPFTGV